MKKRPFHIQLVPIKTIKGAEYNPRAFDPKRFALIKESLNKLGWLLPAYACNGVLLSGHQRTLAWKELGYKEIPVVEVEGLSHAERDPQFQNAIGRTNYSETQFSHANMIANFESNTILGEIISGAPKAQKFYTLPELKEQVEKYYHNVIGFDSGNNVYCHGSAPRKIDKKKLREAIEFEFNLPYPNDKSLGMEKEAIKAFKMRGVL